MFKRNLAFLMTLIMVLSLFVGMTGNVYADELEGDKPVIKIVMMAQATDLNQDPMVPKVKEISGYDVEFIYVPRDNAVEKLLLDLASGVDYDICVFFNYADYSTVAETGALMDISGLLNQYGQNILTNVSDMAMATVTYDSGAIYGMPVESFKHYAGDLKGALTGGFAFRSDVLAEMGAEVPANLEELHTLCAAYLEKTGKAPIATKSADLGWNKDIASALGLGGAFWYQKDGKLIPRIRMEAFREYLALLQSWYKEGIIDPDMPINSSENVTEKFLNSALCSTEFYFWSIPSVLDAVTMNNPDAEILVQACFSKDADSVGTFAESTGVQKVYAVPKTSKHPEHAINYMNILSDMDNFLKTYLGEEGESYEVRDGSYYPLFPGFNDYQNSDNFTGLGVVSEMGKMWQARARKTPEMAVCFDKMNATANDLTYIYSPEGYAASLPAYRDYFTQVTTEINDIVIKTIVDGSDVDKAVEECIATWERDGGLQIEEEIGVWYDANRTLFEQP